MFFLSEIDQKRLVNQILPKARKVGVSEDLRGWSWYKSPLKPYFEDTSIPMYSVCSKYCPTGRDVYLNIVKGARGKPSKKVILGAAIHETVRTTLIAYIEGRQLDFDEWYKSVLDSKRVQERDELVRARSRSAWRLTQVACENRFMEGMSRQPYASRRDLMATTIPFLVEHRISGELLGLSGLLRIDCFDYLRNIVFDIKVSDVMRSWYRLYPTGYALVLESVYEIPVDVGCIVYVKFRESKLSIDRDLFFISDDLRSWWVEERDEKLKMVAQKMDPGVPDMCFEECIYREACGVEASSE